MKEIIHDLGIKGIFGDDFITMQQEQMSSWEALLSNYGELILSGCNIENSNLQSGYCFLEGKIRKIPQVDNITLPCYIIAKDYTEGQRDYKIGGQKPAYNVYSSEIVYTEPTSLKFIKINTDGTFRTLKDALDITQKADKTFVDGELQLVENVLTNKINNKADKNHIHDDIYYTKQEINNLDKIYSKKINRGVFNIVMPATFEAMRNIPEGVYWLDNSNYNGQPTKIQALRDIGVYDYGTLEIIHASNQTVFKYIPEGVGQSSLYQPAFGVWYYARGKINWSKLVGSNSSISHLGSRLFYSSQINIQDYGVEVPDGYVATGFVCYAPSHNGSMHVNFWGMGMFFRKLKIN